MPNLLPERNKKKILQEYRLRLFVALLCAILVITVIGIAFLIPSYIYLSAEYSDRVSQQEKVVAVIKETAGDSYLFALKDTTDKVVVLRGSEDSSTLLKLISTISDHTVSGISLSTIDYSASSAGSAQLTLTGKALTRDSLINFKNSVEEEKSFTSVQHSITDLIKSQNLPFSLNIQGNF
jgi:hypothetical protein